MQLKPGREQVYADWKANNRDPRGRKAFALAEAWGLAMEGMLEVGATVQDVAEACLHRAIDLLDPVEGYAINFAGSVLVHCWQYGDQLKTWHVARGGTVSDAVSASDPTPA